MAMEPTMKHPEQGSGPTETNNPPDQRPSGPWRSRYEGSFAQDFAKGLGSLLLSVLPLIIVLSAYASHRIQDDIARHLGLSTQGGRIIEGLFKASVTSFNLGILVSLILAFAGTIAVARSVEVIYERAFELPPLRGTESLVRCVVWVVFVSAVAVADAAIGKTLRDGPAGPFVIGLVELVGFTLFFWWSIHFRLGAREPWRGVLPAALATSAFWIGLGVFAALYFSSTIVSDSKTYGTIGVTFTLVTWFIGMGAVVTLGAVVGAVWQRRRGGTP